MQQVTAILQRKAIELADAHTGEVFLKAYKSLLIKEQLDFDDDEHFRHMDKYSRNQGCGCWLCKLRYEFTWRKLEVNRRYKRATNDNFVYVIRGRTKLSYHDDQETCAKDDLKRVDELKEEMAQIHLIKDIIKQRLGYDKSKKSTRVPEEIAIYRWGLQNLRTDLFL